MPPLGILSRLAMLCRQALVQKRLGAAPHLISSHLIRATLILLSGLQALFTPSSRVPTHRRYHHHAAFPLLLTALTLSSLAGSSLPRASTVFTLTRIALCIHDRTQLSTAASTGIHRDPTTISAAFVSVHCYSTHCRHNHSGVVQDDCKYYLDVLHQA